MKWQEGLATMQKLGFLTDDHMTLETQSFKLDVKKFDIISKESVKRQPVMTHVAKISKTFLDKKKPSNLCSRSYQVNQLCPRSQNCILGRRRV